MFDQLQLRKIIKIIATRCQILRLECTKFDFGWGSAPDPAGGAYGAPPDPLAGFKGPTSKGGEGRGEGRAGDGREGREGRRGKKGREGEGKRTTPSEILDPPLCSVKNIQVLYRSSETFHLQSCYAIFGKTGRLASEEVTLHLLKTKCVLVLLYGLEALPLNKSQISSLDFVINRFFMKLFNTNNIEIVKCCQQEFCFTLPSITLARRTENCSGKIRQYENLLVKRLLRM